MICATCLLKPQETEYEAALDQWRYLDLPSEDVQALGLPEPTVTVEPGA